MTSESLRDAGRDGTAARAAALPAVVRETHRAVLRAFLATGRAPHVDELRRGARATALDEDLRELTSTDLIHIGPDGRVVAAYPFSGEPTGHTVQLEGGVAVEAMCDK